MNRKTLFAALTCALLAFTMLGCGATNKLKSIQLTAALINGAAPNGQSGTVTLSGTGGTIQLLATGTYSGGTTQDLTKVVTYSVIVDPNNPSDGDGGVLLPPCQAPACPVPGAPPYTNGTVEYSPTGLITAVEPAECTWVNSAPASSSTPAWAYVGDYIVTVTIDGVTSQPFYIPVGSAAGVVSNSNLTGACGPVPTS
ncbi:MAG: hypothetical protein ABSA27_14810 [Terriglobales bacterium]